MTEDWNTTWIVSVVSKQTRRQMLKVTNYYGRWRLWNYGFTVECSKFPFWTCQERTGMAKANCKGVLMALLIFLTWKWRRITIYRPTYVYVYLYIQLIRALQLTGGAVYVLLFSYSSFYWYTDIFFFIPPTGQKLSTVFAACLASQIFILPMVNNTELGLEIWIGPIFLCVPPTLFCLLLFVRAACILAIPFLLCISYAVPPFTSLHSCDQYGSTVWVHFSCWLMRSN